MKQVHVSRGRAVVLEIPSPRPGKGEVLIRVRSSCLSVGTELSGMKASATPLWKRALRDPGKVSSTLKKASTEGVARTWRFVRSRSVAASQTGYSASGTVIETGTGIDDIVPGDRVACAGAGYANHAEFVRVPRNLCTIIPKNVDWGVASTVTLGAIALHGVRRANPSLGETIVVIGLGILGQLTVQILRANGCRVIGVDLDEKRVGLATTLGMDVGLTTAGISDEMEHIARLTGGLGADGAIVTAASPDNSIMSTAFHMCRRKGRVVLVGDVGLDLNRADFYVKEIDFLISTSYGPGRYDRRYEEQGLDYPAAYVRWTENRNMQEYIRLLSTGQVRVEPLISATFPVTDATDAYAAASQSSNERPMIVLLEYPEDTDESVRTLKLRSAPAAPDGRIRVALVGAGSFARSVHIPNLLSLKKQFSVQTIVARNGSNAISVAREFDVANASTDFSSVLEDQDIDAVIIATRHDLHAEMALAALQAGKHVLVEKPMALTHEDVDTLDAFICGDTEKPVPVLMTGYNRRFSPFSKAIADLLASRSAPFMLNYRMNAGYIPGDHWVHGPEGGGRNLGEACHIYDLFVFLSGGRVETVSAQAISSESGYYGIKDNFAVTMKTGDGSVVSLMYTAMGCDSCPKETADLFVDGNVAFLEDYRCLRIYGPKAKTIRSRSQDKGHRNELISFSDGIRTSKWPIAWEQQMLVARVALAVDEELQSGS